MTAIQSHSDSPWAHGAPTGKGHISPWLIAFVVALPPFMEVLDVTIATVALPQIAGGLGASIEDATWVLTWYLLANAVTLPMTDWLATTFGRRRLYLGCIGAFTFSSLLCGLANTLALLVAFRILQGVTGAGLQTLSQAILADTFPPAKRGQGFAAFSLAVVMAPALGPTIGGWLTDNWSWHWIFLVNVPVGLITLLVVSSLIRDPPWEEAHRREKRAKGQRVDLGGLLLIISGISSLLLLLEQGQEENWFASNFITACAVIAGLSLPTLVVWELRHPSPILNLRLFKDRGFTGANALIMAFALFVVGTTQILPEFAQGLLGYTPTQAGLALTFGGLILIVGMPLVGQLVQRIQPKYLIAGGLLVQAGTFFFLYAGWNTNLSFWGLTLDRMIQMAGVPFIAVPIFTAAYTGLPAGQNDQAAGLLNMNRALGGAIGIALLQTLLQRRQQMHHNQLIGSLTPYDPPFQQALTKLQATWAQLGAGPDHAMQQAYTVIYQQLQGQARMLAYLDLFMLIGLAALLALPLVLLLRPVQR